MFLLAGTVLAIVGPSMGVIAVGKQRGHVVVRDQPDVTALAAIAAIGPTLGHHCLAAKRDTARSPITTAEIHGAFVDKLALDHA